MDLDIALANFRDTLNIMNAIGVPFFLTAGTLLGAIRDGGFISWDNDIDFGAPAEDVSLWSFVLFVALMKRKGFAYRFKGVWGQYMTVSCVRDGVMVELTLYYRVGDRRVVYDVADDQVIEYSFPALPIESPVSMELYGEEVLVPRPASAILTSLYGDWSVRQTDWDWSSSPHNIRTRRKRTVLERVQWRLSELGLRVLAKMVRVILREGDGHRMPVPAHVSERAGASPL